MEHAQTKSPLSYKPSLIFWVGSHLFGHEELQQYHRIKSVADISGIPFRESDCDDLSNTGIKILFNELASAGIEPGTTIVSVAGGFLEDHISRFCLHAIAEGYDAYLICDAVFALGKSHIQTHILRLTQFGVVPSSVNQMISFLIADEMDEQVIAGLNQHLQRAE